MYSRPTYFCSVKVKSSSWSEQIIVANGLLFQRTLNFDVFLRWGTLLSYFRCLGPARCNKNKQSLRSCFPPIGSGLPGFHYRTQRSHTHWILFKFQWGFVFWQYWDPGKWLFFFFFYRIPVSYTHLDVYKRQTLYTTN